MAITPMKMMFTMLISLTMETVTLVRSLIMHSCSGTVTLTQSLISDFSIPSEIRWTGLSVDGILMMKVYLDSGVTQTLPTSRFAILLRLINMVRVPSWYLLFVSRLPTLSFARQDHFLSPNRASPITLLTLPYLVRLVWSSLSATCAPSRSV